MELKVIDFETAKLAKEVGFDEETLHFYVKPNSKMFGVDEQGRTFPIKNIPKKLYTVGKHATLNHKNVYSAPTQELLRKFLRTKYNIDIHIKSHQYEESDTKDYFTEVRFWNESPSNDCLRIGIYDSYEQALEAGLKEALKYLLNKKE